jgi:hypothetical protein
MRTLVSNPKHPPTLQDWIALPEMNIPDGGREETVLKAAFWIVRLVELRDAGVTSYAPVGDDVHGLLGGITIKGSAAPVTMRLPAVIAGWAAECCRASQQGGKPFPARVRFQAERGGVEVAYVDLAPKFIAPSAGLVLYVDESGNDGDAAIVSNLTGDQPSFALVGIGEEDSSDVLHGIMGELRRRHRIKATEIKGRTLERHPELVFELVNAVTDAGLPLFVELMDKWFFVAANIVSHILLGPWLPQSRNGRVQANVLAEVITEHVGAAAIVSYCEFGRSPSRATFEAFKNTFRQEIASAKERAADANLAGTLALIANAFDESIGTREGPAGASNSGYLQFLQPPDRTAHGKIIAMLPHVPAFTHLYARVNRFAPDSVTVRTLHDQQSHVGPLLQSYAMYLESNAQAQELNDLAAPERANWQFASGKFSLDFADSRKSPGIQAADIIARFCTRRLNAVITGSTTNDDQTLSTLWNAQDPSRGPGLYVVSTSRRFELFWGTAASQGPFGPSTKLQSMR